MRANLFLTTMALVGLTAAPLLAQTPAVTPSVPGRPAAAAPAAIAPAAPAARATSPASAPASAKVNLNTASAAELDVLPGIGDARSKAIVAERAKGKFKDWADFDKRMTGRTVNADAKSKIKDLVSF